MASTLAGIGVGVVSELGAYARRLWVYRSPLYPVLNVLLMFGLVMGTLAHTGAALGASGLFGVGFGIGLVYEVLNFAVLDWWFFPDDRLLMLRGKSACAIGVSLAWGAVPVMVTSLTALAAH